MEVLAKDTKGGNIMSPSQPVLAPVIDVELRPKSQALEATTETGLTMFERMVRDPSVDVDKLERLMAMHERAQARLAQEQFNAAMSAAQKEMRPVAADAHNKQTNSWYASYAALDNKIRPIYTRHGFGLSFDTGDSPLADNARVLCHVSHSAGCMRTYHVDMPTDGKGARGGDVMTKTHAVGAALAYGARYLLKMIFNIAVGEDDRDGNDPPVKEVKAPAGFDDWWTDLQATADDGYKALEAAWKASKAEYRHHLNETARPAWEQVKTRAAKVPA